LRVIFMGTPEFAVPCLEQLVHNQYKVVAVYTKPDKPVGRGRSPMPSPVKKVALARGLPLPLVKFYRSPFWTSPARGVSIFMLPCCPGLEAPRR
jgi:methionyl-tRNA formyltransferase